MNRKTILVYCQYLLGIGHMQRCALIVQALSKHHIVHIALGGAPVKHIDFGAATLHYLTPVRSADQGFSGLVHSDGSEFNERDKTARCDELLALAKQTKPDALVIETYPFGRRAMRFELHPLLQWARSLLPRPLIVASVRDILQRRKAIREQECLAIVNAYFDKVWVHGDPSLVSLQDSFPLAEQLEDKLSYTGYVAPLMPVPKAEREGILVSAGGGAAGKQIMQAALELFKQGYRNDTRWTITTGPHLDEATKQHLKAAEGNRLHIYPFLENLCEHMSHHQLSLSMAGYNTAMDVLQSGIASVMIPFEGTGETEQLQRTELLEQRGRVIGVRANQLNPDSLAKAMDTALSTTTSDLKLDLEGAQNALAQMSAWLDSDRSTT
ncbi:MAG: glycosyltransferase family protein [Granulosicoccaceae bacterium]